MKSELFGEALADAGAANRQANMNQVLEDNLTEEQKVEKHSKEKEMRLHKEQRHAAVKIQVSQSAVAARRLICMPAPPVARSFPPFTPLLCFMRTRTRTHATTNSLVSIHPTTPRQNHNKRYCDLHESSFTPPPSLSLDASLSSIQLTPSFFLPSFVLYFIVIHFPPVHGTARLGERARAAVASWRAARRRGTRQ